MFGGTAPTLEVEVIAFDDLRLQSGRAVRVELKVILHDDDGVMIEDTLTMERPVPGDKPQIEDVIGALAGALDVAVDQVALRVQKALAARGAASSTAKRETR